MHVFMLILIATAGGQSATAHEVFKTEKPCMAEGKRAEKIASDSKGVSVKWECKPATRVVEQNQ